MNAKRIVFAAIAAALLSTSPAHAGKVTKTIVTGAAGLALRHGAKVVVQKSISRLTPELGRIARACLAKQFGPELRQAITDRVMSELVDAYLDEMVTDHGAPKHTREERQYAKSEFVDKQFERLSKSDTEAARKQYNNPRVQQNMRSDWSDQRGGARWPRSGGTLPSGELIPEKMAQLHHNKPIAFGGSPTDSRNATPLFPKGHQGGVHRRNGMLAALLNCMKARGK